MEYSYLNITKYPKVIEFGAVSAEYQLVKFFANGRNKQICKKLVMINDQLHILVEQTVTGKLSAKKLLGNQFKQSPQNMGRHQGCFRNQKLCINKS